jgi:hypothetical protein
MDVMLGAIAIDRTTDNRDLIAMALWTPAGLPSSIHANMCSL